MEKADKKERDEKENAIMHQNKHINYYIIRWLWKYLNRGRNSMEDFYDVMGVTRLFYTKLVSPVYDQSKIDPNLHICGDGYPGSINGRTHIGIENAYITGEKRIETDFFTFRPHPQVTQSDWDKFMEAKYPKKGEGEKKKSLGEEEKKAILHVEENMKLIFQMIEKATETEKGNKSDNQQSDEVKKKLRETTLGKLATFFKLKRNRKNPSHIALLQEILEVLQTITKDTWHACDVEYLGKANKLLTRHLNIVKTVQAYKELFEKT